MGKLKTYLRSLDSEQRRVAFAIECGTTLGHMRNALYGLRTIAPEVCVSIERATSGAVTRRDLRPDDWWLIWPELVTAEHPVPVAKEAA